ncbi:MAG: hypothetical protein GWP09_01640, partial [Nitrospiraceae bacterium]|nr:hypothetical protein [Nitrospiraceae bacterium]
NSVGSEETPIVNGSIESILIKPNPFWHWDKFYANANVPSGTSISYELLNPNNVSVCSITSSDASSGCDVCDSAQGYSRLYLLANLSSSSTLVNPELLNWSISWIPTANVSISVVNSSGSVDSSSMLWVYNSNNDLVSSGNGNVLTNIETNKLYELKSLIPINSYNFSSDIVGLNITDNKSIEEQIVRNYEGDLPSEVSRISSVFAFNSSGYDFNHAKLIFPKNGLAVDKILHCTSWDYVSHNCSSWNVSNTSDYVGFGYNDSYFWFNVSEFDAYAGGSSLDLILENVSTNNSNPVQGDDIGISVNVSLVGDVNLTNVELELNISKWNGSVWIFNKSIIHDINISANSYIINNFSWVAEPGTYRFDAYVDPDNSVSEANESNNEKYINYSVPEWEVFYGYTNGTIVLANSNFQNFSLWIPTNVSGNLYFSNSNAAIDFGSLKALNGSNDLSEVDAALNITGFNDSVSNLYDKNHNGVADSHENFTVFGSVISDVPVVNSTNSSNFISGILWDSSSGDSSIEYDGSQNLVFVTKINENKVGKYGVYDYEIRVPAALGYVNNNNGILNINMELG